MIFTDARERPLLVGPD